MLTGDLLRVRLTRTHIRPQLVSPTSPKHTERAEQLLHLFGKALEKKQSRKEIQDWVAELSSLDVEHKIFKGFAKVLLDRAEFTEPILPVENPPTAVQVRADVFSLAAQKGTFSQYSRNNEPYTKQAIYEEVAQKYGCSAQEIQAYLYSDLRTMQRIHTLKSFSTPALLIHRYNIALCQAVLLRACSLEITFASMDPKWLRYLFGLIKFHNLMFLLEKKGDKTVLTLDGPQSLFQKSTRYGMQLALFLPGLLLVPTPWSLKGVIEWNKRKKKLELDHDAGMLSHYKERGVWRSDAERVFEERFKAKETGWRIGPGKLIKLKGQRILQPDFTLKKGKRTVHLEIIGFWRKGQLSSLLQDCPDNVFLLVSRRLAGDKSGIPPKIAQRVVPFAEVIPVSKVLDAIE